MKTIGERLRAAREGKGVSLKEISDETKISLRYLEAIENGDAANLPGAVFARNFSRQYANFIGQQYLGLKPAELDEQIRAAFPTEAESLPPALANTSSPTGVTNSIQVAPLSDSWNWNKIGLSFGALIAVLGAGAVVFRIWQEAPSLIESARNQANQVETTPANVPTPPANVPRANIELSQTQPVPDGTAVTPASTNAAAGVPETTITISTSGMAVRVVAEQDTWVSMTANGTHVFSDLIKANESRVISGVSNARMVIGNAGGVKIATDGKDIGPIGLPGQVRVVMISPDGSKIATGPVL